MSDAKTEALIKRIASGETTEADAKAVGEIVNARDEMADQLKLNQQAYMLIANAAGMPEAGPETIAAHIASVNAQAAQDETEVDGYAQVMKERDELRDLVTRIRQWDMLDAAHDGPYFKNLIDAVLKVKP